MNNQKYLDDIKEIKEMMTRSSRFISLSGLSGISAGVVALVGAYFAWDIVYADANYQNFNHNLLNTRELFHLLVIGALTLVLAVGAGIFFTIRKARKNNHDIWDAKTKQLLLNLLIPLASGGIFCLLLLLRGYIGLIAPLTLLFYGLALVNASKYTITEVRSLGIMEITLGLVSTYFIGYGLLFWILGFGVLHIVYGIIMELRYKS